MICDLRTVHGTTKYANTDFVAAAPLFSESFVEMDSFVSFRVFGVFGG